MSDTDLIWNRAAIENGGPMPASGDRALSALLYAHGLAMNGGVLHAVEHLTSDELADAQLGYSLFGITEISHLLTRSRKLFNDGGDLGIHERSLDAEYLAHIPNDSALIERFERHFHLHPSDFAPL